MLVKAGDDNALNAFLEKYRLYSYKLVGNYLNDYPEYDYIRDELHAIVFYGTYNLISKYDSDKGHFYGYWKKISLRNIDKYIEKYEKYNSVISLDYQQNNDIKSLHDVVGNEDETYRQELLKQAYFSIIYNPNNGFSQKEKEVIELYLKGFDMKDIATKTNRAITSVYRLFKRAVLKIGCVMKGQNK